jgi:hypothetical protein
MEQTPPPDSPLARTRPAQGHPAKQSARLRRRRSARALVLLVFVPDLYEKPTDTLDTRRSTVLQSTE